MQKSITVGQLRQIIRDLPDNLPIYASNPIGSERLDEHYYLTKARFSPECSIANEHLSLELGDEFGW